MENPLIGITAFGRNFEGHFSIPAQFVECVRRAGGIPVLMPPGEPHLDEWFETVDAVLISSGVDVEPALYEGAGHASIDAFDRERDHDEAALVHQAVEAEVPLLATCRGMQILNVALGGDLFPHIPDCIEDAIEHRAPNPTGDPHEYGGGKFKPLPHQIVLDPGSRLAQVMGVVRMEPLSWHHQAVDELGDGLVAVGHAPDGVVEAVEMPEHPWLFGVQWHPELTAADDPVQQRLFDAMVAAARGE